MTDVDRRLLQVSIEVDGQMQVFNQDFDIHAVGKKTANPLQNDCTVTIQNLTKEVRNYLLTETSPFNKNKTPKRLLVEAGRQSIGMTLLFEGNVVSSTPSQPPDIGLVLRAQTGAQAKTKVLARSGRAQQSLRSLAQAVAGDIDCALDFQATDKQIANYAFNGSALKQVDALQAAGGVDAYVDNKILVVKDRGKPLAGRVRIVNQKTGMIGIPEVTERGLKVTMLLDNETTLGGALEVTSELNPSVNGSYSIYQLGFDVASRAPPFYYIAEATRR
jgi:hypothetical protein